MLEYEFGAGGFKLGERVEILTTGQRGILITETIHISGCNTYLILLPDIMSDYFEGKMKTTHRDCIMLRKLESNESLFDKEKELNDNNSFLPKGTDVESEWIKGAIKDEKEFTTEIDDAVGVEEIAIAPGTEVWHKVYGKTMLITHIIRDIYSKELVYGAMYMSDNREIVVFSRAYALIPMESKFNLPSTGKKGSMYEDLRDCIKDREISFVSRF